MIEINLQFEKMKTFITGRKFATTIFEDQINPNLETINIEKSELIIINFPDQIKGVSISFTKQIVQEFIDKYGRDVRDCLSFQSNNKNLENKIREDIYF